MQGFRVERALTTREGGGLEVERPCHHLERHVNIWIGIFKIFVFVPIKDLLEVIRPVNKDVCKKYQHSKIESACS